jgi:hypothetical protein
VTRRSAQISGLAPATWYFSTRAVNTLGVESADSNIASKAVTGASAANTVAITITGSSTPGRKTIATPVYDLTRDANGRWTLGRIVGSIAIGRSCRTYHLSGDYYGVQTGAVTLTRAMRGNTLVAHCAYAN